MTKTVRAALTLTIALGFGLAACDREQPREKSAGEPVETPSEPAPPDDVPAEEPDTRAPAAPTQVQASEAQIASQGLSWFYKPGWALFGPPRSEGVFTIQCRRPAPGEASLVITRAVGAEAAIGATHALDFRGESTGFSTPMTAEATELGPAIWTGRVENREALARALSENDGGVVLDMGQSAPIALPPSEEAAKLVRGCRP